MRLRSLLTCLTLCFTVNWASAQVPTEDDIRGYYLGKFGQYDISVEEEVREGISVAERHLIFIEQDKSAAREYTSQLSNYVLRFSGVKFANLDEYQKKELIWDWYFATRSLLRYGNDIRLRQAVVNDTLIKSHGPQANYLFSRPLISSDLNRFLGAIYNDYDITLVANSYFDGKVDKVELERALVRLKNVLDDQKFKNSMESEIVKYNSLIGVFPLIEASLFDRLKEYKKASRDLNLTINERAIGTGIPFFAITIMVLFVGPYFWRVLLGTIAWIVFARRLDRAKNSGLPKYPDFEGGTIVLETSTVFLLTSTILILGLALRLREEILGTLLGGISGYVLSSLASRKGAEQATGKKEEPTPPAKPTGPETQPTVAEVTPPAPDSPPVTPPAPSPVTPSVPDTSAFTPTDGNGPVDEKNG